MTFVTLKSGKRLADCSSSVVRNCWAPLGNRVGNPCFTDCLAPENSDLSGAIEIVIGTLVMPFAALRGTIGMITRDKLLCLSILSIGTQLIYGTTIVLELFVLRFIS